MARARISKSHQLQFSFIGNLNIWVHQFQYFLQVAEGGNKQFRAPGTTSSVCPFVPFVLSAEQATLKAKDEHWSLCRDGKDLLFTPYFCHPLLFLCPRSEYGSDFLKSMSSNVWWHWVHSVGEQAWPDHGTLAPAQQQHPLLCWSCALPPLAARTNANILHMWLHKLNHRSWPDHKCQDHKVSGV